MTNKNLSTKVKQAVALIKSAGKIAAEHGQPLEICYSGGKDSDVILALAKMAGVVFEAVYKNTTIDPPGTIKHARSNNAVIIQPKHTFFELVQQHGLPNRWRRFCCSYLKEYKVYDYAVIGVRRSESANRAKRYSEPEVCRIYNKKQQVRQYLPILEWSNSDILEFITTEHIKCHPLYYDANCKFDVTKRLGCLCCPLQYSKKRINEFKKYPHMVKLYLNALQKYFDSHPNSKLAQIYDNNIYDILTCSIFCNDKQADFMHKFGENLLFDKIDTKAYLSSQFNVNL